MTLKYDEHSGYNKVAGKFLSLHVGTPRKSSFSSQTQQFHRQSTPQTKLTALSEM